MNASPNQNIAETVTKMAQEILDVTEIPNIPIREAFDSMNRLSLMVAIEDHFLIAFEPEEEDAIDSLEDLIQCIQQKVHSS